MATYSNNTTLRIAGGGTSNTGGVLFTTASNQYAIVTATNTLNNGNLTIGLAIFGLVASGSPSNFNPHYVPPGTAVSVSAASGFSYVSWVIFENSP